MQGSGAATMVSSEAKKPKVLIFEDELAIADIMVKSIRDNNYEVMHAATGEEGLMAVGKFKPDIILLDLMLPGIDGQTIGKFLVTNEETKDIPIIVISARNYEDEIVGLLNQGVSDYLTKPFRLRELLARMKRLLEKHIPATQAEPNDNSLVAGPVSMNLDKHEVFVHGEKIHLTFSEFKILELFLKNKGWVFTRDKIISTIHGEDYFVNDRAIDVQIAGLRRKLKDQGNQVKTVRGIGYRFEESTIP